MRQYLKEAECKKKTSYILHVLAELHHNSAAIPDLSVDYAYLPYLNDMHHFVIDHHKLWHI